jgi:hypothetical protein
MSTTHRTVQTAEPTTRTAHTTMALTAIQAVVDRQVVVAVEETDMPTFFDNNADFAPGSIGADFTGPEVFELVHAAVNKQIVEAEHEIGRLTRAVKYNAAAMREDGSDVSVGIPGCHSSRATEDQIALQAARAQLAAVKAVWLAVHHGVAGPSVTGTTREGVEKTRSEFKAKARAHLDRWKAGLAGDDR